MADIPGADGRISRTVRPRRKKSGIDDPADNPTLHVTVSDLDGRSAEQAAPRRFSRLLCLSCLPG